MRKLLTSAPPDQKVDVHVKRGNLFPLDVVARHNEAAARLLIEAGANPNPVHRSWAESPLYAAIGAGNYDTAVLLLNSGANPNTFNDLTGFSALTVARFKGKTKLVNLLVERGATRIWQVRINEFIKGYSIPCQLMPLFFVVCS